MTRSTEVYTTNPQARKLRIGLIVSHCLTGYARSVNE